LSSFQIDIGKLPGTLINGTRSWPKPSTGATNRTAKDLERYSSWTSEIYTQWPKKLHPSFSVLWC